VATVEGFAQFQHQSFIGGGNCQKPRLLKAEVFADSWIQRLEQAFLGREDQRRRGVRSNSGAKREREFLVVVNLRRDRFRLLRRDHFLQIDPHARCHRCRAQRADGAPRRVGDGACHALGPDRRTMPADGYGRDRVRRESALFQAPSRRQPAGQKLRLAFGYRAAHGLRHFDAEPREQAGIELPDIKVQRDQFDASSGFDSSRYRAHESGWRARRRPRLELRPGRIFDTRFHRDSVRNVPVGHRAVYRADRAGRGRGGT